MGSGGHMPRPYPPSDDIDPQATRSLFVGNIPKNISVFQLRDIFQRYGDVLVSCVRMWCLCVCVHTCTCLSFNLCVYMCVSDMYVCGLGHRCSLVNHSQGPVQLSVAPQYGKAGKPCISSCKRWDKKEVLWVAVKKDINLPCVSSKGRLP